MTALVPPFTRETATAKVRMAEDAWNSRDPHRVSLAYTENSRWRNRAEFINGRAEIVAFLTRKWRKELDYRLIKELWAFTGDRIAVRFAYEWHDDSGHWFRSYGNENWEFDAAGVMQRRFASINDLPINDAERKYHWPLGRRPDDHPGLSELAFDARPRRRPSATRSAFEKPDVIHLIASPNARNAVRNLRLTPRPSRGFALRPGGGSPTGWCGW
jgi:uncharacterized protein